MKRHRLHLPGDPAPVGRGWVAAIAFVTGALAALIAAAAWLGTPPAELACEFWPELSEEELAPLHRSTLWHFWRRPPIPLEAYDPPRQVEL